MHSGSVSHLPASQRVKASSIILHDWLADQFECLDAGLQLRGATTSTVVGQAGSIPPIPQYKISREYHPYTQQRHEESA